MTYRLLPPAEWDRLAADFAAYGGRVPAEGSRIAVAEDNGQIVGFLVLQWVPHAEPLWIEESQRGKVYWPKLLHLLEADLHGGEYYIFAPDDRIRDFALAADCDELSWKVFRKELN